MVKKALVLFSGGLDSLIVVELLKEQGFEVYGIYFKLPFGSRYSFLDKKSFRGKHLEVFDCTKGKFLKEYLEVIRKPKYGRGKGFNPCVDCRIFILNKAKQYANKKGISVIATGEVLGERPMSQNKKAIKIVEEKTGLENNLLRPLSAKKLKETNAEKKGIINRDKLLDIEGRRRQTQISLAKKYKIKFPSPSGGCVLCEKVLKDRFKVLLKRDLNSKEISILTLGRHFIIDEVWIVLGRNEKENEILKDLKDDFEFMLNTCSGPSALILDKSNKKIRQKIYELISAYSKGGTLEQRKKFDKFKI